LKAQVQKTPRGSKAGKGTKLSKSPKAATFKGEKEKDSPLHQQELTFFFSVKLPTATHCFIIL